MGRKIIKRKDDDGLTAEWRCSEDKVVGQDGTATTFEHWIVVKANGKQYDSPKATYRGIAKLTVLGVTYYACTLYYDGTFPTQTIFTVEVV